MISKLRLNKSSIIAKAENEKGIVLIGAISLVAILALLGTVSVVTTSTELIISRNYKASVQASYAAQAGIEEARLRLRGSSSDPNYAGDPTANPDPTWSSYILTSNSWQTSYDPDYVGTYTNYIPTTSSHTNTATETNTIQTDISYWVKIRHKRESDLLPNETYTDGGSTANDIIYYGYVTSTSTTLEHFTTTDVNPVTASPVEIITSYGSNGKSSSIVEVHTRKIPGPPIVAGIYGNNVDINGNVDITGDDACSSGSIPCVGYSTNLDLTGGAIDLVSQAGPSTQITPAIDVTAQVDALESTATVIWGDADDPAQNITVGSISNYEIVFCDATQLSDLRLDINNLTGYGTLVVRGDLDLGGSTTWYGLIIVSGDITISGNGTNIHGAIVANDVAQLSGNIDIYYDTCKLDYANGSYRYATSRWEDKKLN
ncbi:MAG: pilus assembly PilX N-terminal domain-containing protein [Candidatus Scalinduaceae bacterium]